ncbi:MAG: hypothetical protein K6E91_00920 [Butyrivibrio sp.]|nr:hypothetical protein [Butyrivibrio sp.]
MDDKKIKDNYRALEAGRDKGKKEAFLFDEQEHILRLTARILKRSVYDSDEEYSLALLAVSEAIDSFDDSKGAFWNYAALVIKRRIIDNMRKDAGHMPELSVSPETFSGDFTDDDDSVSIGIVRQIAGKTASYVDNSLRDEIEALSDELEGYGIDLFELPAIAPKTEKTRRSCIELLKSFFSPPPLTDELKRTGTLPMKEMVRRSGESRKLAERFRKYLIAAVLVRSGDYDEIGEYISLGN